MLGLAIGEVGPSVIYLGMGCSRSRVDFRCGLYK